MSSHRYLIVGGGMTADAACKGIRATDSEGSILLVGEEPHAPYARPPLSKGLWSGKDEDSIWRGTDQHGVDLLLGRAITSLDIHAKEATDDRGEVHAYERVLLATGGRPRRLPGAPDGVVYFRTLDDYRRLREQASAGGRAVVIGGGFIGSEVAAALAPTGMQVTMLFPEAGIGARLFPPRLAAAMNEYYAAKGVEVLPGQTVASIQRDGDAFRVTTGDGQALEASVVVAGLGIEPQEELAAQAGLAVGNGIPVDDRGRVGGRDDVFAAGDVARFPSRVLGLERRVEHEDHAKTHGAHVGANMAGADEPYEHLPFFYSDLFDLGYEAVGEVDSRLGRIAHWNEPNRNGVVAYLDAEQRPRGFLLWGIFGKVDVATELIRAGEPLDIARLCQVFT
jgi:NADPH-dependent 2,4-dienoyl-CoA reductase/sulfur reductase-like enzyme